MGSALAASPQAPVVRDGALVVMDRNAPRVPAGSISSLVEVVAPRYDPSMASPSSDRIRALVPGETQVRRKQPWLAPALVFCLFLDFILCRDLGAAAPVEAAAVDFFENRIRPVLVENCYECHSATAKKLKSGLRVDSREALLKGGDTGPAVVPGDPTKSRLLRAVRHEEPDLTMPPKTPKLPDAVIADLATWVKQGAPFPSSFAAAPEKPHWAFQPVRNQEVPVVSRSVIGNQSSVGARRRTDSLNTASLITPSPIDSFILAKLPTKQPAPPADKRTLLRRATYDLTGLPPTADAADAFEKDSSTDAFAKVVERLLASRQYGERWGRHWLDLVRYADTAGETADYPVPVAWRYRNWVIDAFNADKPYDEFLREQIAGDILARQGARERYAERVTATGYLAISRRFGFDSENYHHLTIQDTIDTLGQTVLGLTLGCARCHAHKFDPISMKDYYALYGIFESTRYAFPGSEQKQKSRALVPLLPPEESQPKWREFDTRVAALARNLERHKQSAPSAVLRSLDDLDGDFEMQAPAAGGSKGVLVAPWVYEGTIAVTADAQSPFKNLYALGKVGASVATGTNAYRIAQAVHPVRTRSSAGKLHVNLDFRIAAAKTPESGNHRFWIGARPSSPAVEVILSPEAVAVRTGDIVKTIRSFNPGQWQNLQLTLDLKSGVVSGSVGQPGDVATIAELPLAKSWNGTIDFVAVDSQGGEGGGLPGIAIDNLRVQEQPIAPVSRELPTLASASNEPDPAALTAQLQSLAGIDGDFELQTDATPPATPWHPGPNSVVKIRASAQSPFWNHFPAGRLGLHLPNSGAYNGFGQTLTNRWKAEKTRQLFASFDFRSANVEKGGDGSWRFYLGNGPGTSAAVELFFNGREFFRRSADKRDVVQPLRVSEWYQVQVTLNLKEKTYAGSIASATNRTEFTGQFASGWDGSIDYTFIDSYGHLGGVKPALDADNFVIGETPLSTLDSQSAQFAEGEGETRRAKISELRRQLAGLAASSEKSKQELQQLLVEGPFDLTYAVSEGTPRNARMQLRGEPDKPGEEVPRGFIEVLGGRKLPAETSGSGRLELAEWLTRPENPLTARVMVNRLWQYHFGQGLVKTPNDFGTRGQPPTHPELLDYLATEFIKRGWSMKAMHRLIMGSATYQQGGVISETVISNQSPKAARGRTVTLNTDSLITDHFSPFPRRRLSAEETRDSILLVSGELDPTPGHGHPFPAPTGWGYTQHTPFSAVYDHNQRSVYLMTQRIKRHPFLALFDGADPNASTADRRTTTVPTQALFFLNDPFVHTKSEKFAARVERLGIDEAQRIEATYRLALGRSASATEQAEAAEFLAAYRLELAEAKQDKVERAALAAFARVLIGSNEFLSVD